MHFEQAAFVSRAHHVVHPNWHGDEKVLEIGSFNNTGSIRSVFDVSRGGEYVGVDLVQGPGVDMVCPGEKVDYADGYFDFVISCECFEHTPMWKEIFLNMHRMTADAGQVLFTCASTGRAEHGTHRWKPGDSLGTQAHYPTYYKNLTAEDFEQAVDVGTMFSDFRFYYNALSKDLYFVGVKGGKELDKPALDRAVYGINFLPFFSGTEPGHWRQKIWRMARYYASPPDRRPVRPTGTTARSLRTPPLPKRC